MYNIFDTQELVLYTHGDPMITSIMTFCVMLFGNTNIKVRKKRKRCVIQPFQHLNVLIA